LLAPFFLVAVPLSPLSEAAVVLPAALLLAGTLFSNLTSAPWPVRPSAGFPAAVRRDAHRKYHTRRRREMPVPAVIPATRLAVQTVPGVLCATSQSAAIRARKLPAPACALRERKHNKR
jgi:hypothetical protein